MSLTSGKQLILTSGAAGGGGYAVSRSLRFNSSDSAYLSRTPSTAGNRKTWTWAGWVKNTCSTATTYPATLLFARNGAGAGVGEYFWLAINNVFTTDGHQIAAGDGNVNYLVSTAFYRDPAAWYHIVCTYDSAQATANNRLRLYVNGVEVTAFNTNNRASITQNSDGVIGRSTIEHRMGLHVSAYSNCYLADIHFIDGQALTPSSFTEVSATTGRLEPKAYSGPTPTGNSFWLPFSDNSAATATTLGKDGFLLGNNWTPNNLSVTPYNRYVGSVSGTGIFSGSWDNVFNGSISPIVSSNWVYIYNGTNTLTFAQSLSGVIEIYAGLGGSPGSANTATLSSGASLSYTTGGYSWRSFGSQANVTSITINGPDPGLIILGIRVNGVELVTNLNTQDSLVDTPTSYGTDTGAGGQVTGNYATLNPLTSAGAFSNGNLEVSVGASAETSGLGTFGLPASGKWYWEVAMTTLGTDAYTGIASGTSRIGLGSAYYAYRTGGSFAGTTGSTPSSGASYTTGDIIGVAYDATAATLAFYKNGSLQGTFTGIPVGLYFPLNYAFNTAARTLNFGQRPFAYTAPSGFKALCDTNLPTPTIAKGATAFDVKLYTGNGSTQSISGLGFSPDLVWIKARNTTNAHQIFDTVRGASIGLSSNTTDADSNNAPYGLTSFGASSFNVNDISNGGYGVNGSSLSQVYAAWCWDAGSTTVTNTQGSITSSVRANPSAGFSICTVTATVTNDVTFGHGLGVAPQLVIGKNRTAANDWITYHKSLAANYALYLNTTGAATLDYAYSQGVSAAPSSTTVPIRRGNWGISGDNLVFYCFAPVAGYSAFGSYTGNGFSAAGPLVFTNMRPRWIMLKRTDTTSNWTIIDTAREGYNVDNDPLYPNLTDAEGTADLADILSNGFKLRSTDASVNASAGTYVYAAFAESPFAYSRAR